MAFVTWICLVTWNYWERPTKACIYLEQIVFLSCDNKEFTASEKMECNRLKTVCRSLGFNIATYNALNVFWNEQFLLTPFLSFKEDLPYICFKNTPLV